MPLLRRRLRARRASRRRRRSRARPDRPLPWRSRTRRGSASATSSTRTRTPTTSRPRASSRRSCGAHIVMHRRVGGAVRRRPRRRRRAADRRRPPHPRAPHAGPHATTRCRSCSPIACSPATRCSSAPPGAPTCRPAIPTRSTTASSASCCSSTTRCSVFPAHDYKDRSVDDARRRARRRTRACRRRDRAEFVALMRGLDIAMPDHLTEALRTNRTGGKTVTQLIAEAARDVPFMAHGGGARAHRARRPATSCCSTSASATPTTPATCRARGTSRAGSSSCASTGAARPDRARPHVLPVRQDLDARRRDAAHDGLSARRRARRRHGGVDARRLSDREDPAEARRSG